MKKVSFNVDGLRLEGTLFYPEKLKEKNPAILFVHGWTSEQERSFQYAEALAKLGFICFLFNMRGHGKSEGEISTLTPKNFLQDVSSAYDYLAQVDNVDTDAISAVGSSFGSYLIVLLSEKRKFINLSLRVPADYPDDIFEKPKISNSGSDNPEVVTWRKKIKKPNETFALKAFSQYSGNVLIIEAEKDTVVPPETVVNYINAFTDESKLTHVVMKDSPHTIVAGKFRDECEQILINWFKDKI
jgi:esterase/lipase